MADGNKAKAAPRKWATEIEHIKRSKIAPSAHNARKHPEDQVIQIADSIMAFGWTIPILIDESNTIIAGEGRWLAAGLLLERGDVASDLIPCIRMEKLNEEQKRALILADNKLAINAEWNIEKVGQELMALDDAGFDLDLTGFAEDEIDQLTKDEDPLVVHEISIDEVNDTFWISVRGPLKDQAKALQRLKEFMAEMPEVDVDLGTISID